MKHSHKEDEKAYEFHIYYYILLVTGLHSSIAISVFGVFGTDHKHRYRCCVCWNLIPQILSAHPAAITGQVRIPQTNLPI